MKQNVVAVGQIQVGRRALVLKDVNQVADLDNWHSKHSEVNIHTVKHTFDGMTLQDYKNHAKWASKQGIYLGQAVKHTTYEGFNIVSYYNKDYDVIAPMLADMHEHLKPNYPYSDLKISMQIPLENLFLIYNVEMDGDLRVTEDVLNLFPMLQKEYVKRSRKTVVDGVTVKPCVLGSLVERLQQDIWRHVAEQCHHLIDEDDPLFYVKGEFPDDVHVEYLKLQADMRRILCDATGFDIELARID